MNNAHPVPLSSGAGHDAYHFAHIGVPTAMVFVPSQRGISHNKEEFTAPHHLDVGVDVLSKAVHELAMAPILGAATTRAEGSVRSQQEEQR